MRSSPLKSGLNSNASVSITATWIPSPERPEFQASSTFSERVIEYSEPG